MPTPRKEGFDYPGMKGDKTVKPKGYVHAQVCWCACQEYSKGNFANLTPGHILPHPGPAADKRCDMG